MPYLRADGIRLLFLDIVEAPSVRGLNQCTPPGSILARGGDSLPRIHARIFGYPAQRDRLKLFSAILSAHSATDSACPPLVCAPPSCAVASEVCCLSLCQPALKCPPLARTIGPEHCMPTLLVAIVCPPLLLPGACTGLAAGKVLGCLAPAALVQPDWVRFVIPVLALGYLSPRPLCRFGLPVR